MSCFQFKQFSIVQDKCAMKVGTDGILLGSWAPLRAEDIRILDIGTGTGLLSLMVAQRHRAAAITAIDIEIAAVEQARANVARSRFSTQIQVKCSEVEAFEALPFDFLICNPPFFDKGKLNTDVARLAARQRASLSFEALVEAATRLTHVGSHWALILPYEAREDFLQVALVGGWKLWRSCTIYPRAMRPAKRILLELGRAYRPTHYTSLTLQDSSAANVYTAEFCALTEDFYLHM